MNRHTRREFLWWAIPGAAVAGASLTALRPWVTLAADAQPAPGQASRSFAAGKYALEIDGQPAGWLESVEGGSATADVVAGKTGPDNIVRKHIAGVKYEDMTVNCGAGMSRNFYEWIKASFDKQYSRKNGAVIACDYNFKEISKIEWFNALITEVGFPALDASSKDAAKMTIKFSPESTRWSAPTGASAGGTYSGARNAAVQKKWLPSNFRLQIGGLEAACTRVNKIEAIVVKQVAVAGAGQSPAPNLVISVPETDADLFRKWHQDFVVKGSAAGGKETGGTLEYLTPDLRESLFTLTFHGLGVSKLSPEGMTASSANIRRVKAEMSCRDITFAYGSAAWA
jgi:phage tail-like protein